MLVCVYLCLIEARSLPCVCVPLCPTQAKNRGLRVSEVTVRGEGNEVLTSLSVSLGTAKSKFSGAVDRTQRIYIEGQVRNGIPFITKIGSFDVELAVTVSGRYNSCVVCMEHAHLPCISTDSAF